MSSYLRNIFGGPSNSSGPTTKSNSRTRSNSQVPPNIYAPASGATSSPSGRPAVQRSYSYSASRSTPPSPLRYTTGADTRSTLGYGKRSTHVKASEPRPHVLRRGSHDTEAVHYPMYTPSASYTTPTSSRSNSSTSIFPGMGSLPRMSSSSDGHHHRHPHHTTSDVRPSLSKNHTWQPGSSAGSSSSYGSLHGNSPVHATSYSNARPYSLHMHPLLAYSRLHRAPITYDVTFTPSARTVLDRATHSAIPAHTLSQPATDPPTAASARLIMRSHKFPWPVLVGGSSGARFTIGPAPKHGSNAVITNMDVLYAVHTTLLAPVTPEEWEALGYGSRAQQKVTRAYERRCTRMGGGWEGGVRRIDWLGEKTRLVGVEVDKSGGNGGTGKLVFGKA